MIIITISLIIIITSIIVHSLCRIPSRTCSNVYDRSLLFPSLAEAARFEGLLSNGDSESIHRIIKALQQRGKSANINPKSVFYLCLGLVILFCTVSLGLPAFIDEAHSADVTVAWDPNPEPAVRGYVIYYGTSSGNYTQSIDVGNETSCAISGLQAGATYYMAVTAYDDSRNESGFSNEIVYAAAESSPASSSGSRCFIATAAFGSPMAPEVAVLRAFRDTWLLTNSPGRIFVEFYYWISPPIADFISRDENLKRITRIVLTPLIYGVKNPAATIFLIFTPLILWVLRRSDRKIRFLQRLRL